MNLFTQAWFYILILAVIGFIIFIVTYEAVGQTNINKPTTPWWVWAILIVSVILFIIAIILYCIAASAEARRYEIALACGEIQPPAPKVIVCPTKKCQEQVEVCSQPIELSQPSLAMQVAQQTGEVVMIPPQNCYNPIRHCPPKQVIVQRQACVEQPQPVYIQQPPQVEEIIVERPSPIQEVIVERPSPIQEVIVERPSPIQEVIVERSQPIQEVIVERPRPIQEVIVERPSPIQEVIVERPQPIYVQRPMCAPIIPECPQPTYVWPPLCQPEPAYIPPPPEVPVCEEAVVIPEESVTTEEVTTTTRTVTISPEPIVTTTVIQPRPIRTTVTTVGPPVTVRNIVTGPPQRLSDSTLAGVAATRAPNVSPSSVAVIQNATGRRVTPQNSLRSLAPEL